MEMDLLLDWPDDFLFIFPNFPIFFIQYRCSPSVLDGSLDSMSSVPDHLALPPQNETERLMRASSQELAGIWDEYLLVSIRPLPVAA